MLKFGGINRQLWDQELKKLIFSIISSAAAHISQDLSLDAIKNLPTHKYRYLMVYWASNEENEVLLSLQVPESSIYCPNFTIFSI